MRVNQPAPVRDRKWTPLTAANAGLAFALELGLLAALCYWGFRTGGGMVAEVALGLGTPVLAAVVWGLFLAAGGPKYPIPPLAQLVLKLALFGLAGWALLGSGHPVLGLVFAGLAVVSVAVEYLA